jgi:hypothetical protein
MLANNLTMEDEEAVQDELRMIQEQMVCLRLIALECCLPTDGAGDRTSSEATVSPANCPRGNCRGVHK